MSNTSHTVQQALRFENLQHHSGSRAWEGLCQKNCRMAYGVPALFGTAFAQWLGAHADDKHVGGHPSDAPLGALLCYKGSNPAGHIMIAARPFGNGVAAGWSNDLVRVGGIDKVARTAPTSKWGQQYLGYLTAINHFDIAELHQRPKPPQVRYKNIADSIQELEGALETAKKQHDSADAKVLSAEIERLKVMYDKLRRNA